MTEQEMIEALRRKGYTVKMNPIVTYCVEIGFAGIIGASETVSVDAPSGLDEDGLMSFMLDSSEYQGNLKDLLGVESVEDMGDGDYVVTFNFGGYVGVENEYSEYALDEDEAVEAALEEALQDFTIEDFSVEEE